MTEAELYQIVVDALELGGWRWKHDLPARTNKGWRTATAGDVGWPDIFAARDGVALALELKSDSGRVHVEQTIWLAELAKVPGVHAMVVRPADIDELIRVLLTKPKRRRRAAAGGVG